MTYKPTKEELAEVENLKTKIENLKERISKSRNDDECARYGATIQKYNRKINDLLSGHGKDEQKIVFNADAPSVADRPKDGKSSRIKTHGFNSFNASI